ncbi:MAG: DmsE family decaheme c-type cytochrome [Acidobacteriota bacterium]
MREPDGEHLSPFTGRALTLSIVSGIAVLLVLNSYKPSAKAQTSAARLSQQTVIGKDCQQCHRLIVQTFALDAHGKSAKFLKDTRAASCEGCHRNSEKHAETSTRNKMGEPADSPANPTAAETNDSCLLCHSRDRSRFVWAGGQHDRSDMSCLSCHSVHHTKLVGTMAANFNDKTDAEIAELISTSLPEHMLTRPTTEETCLGCHVEQRKALFQRSTHLFRTELRNMKVGCTSCHNPHGGEGGKMLQEFTVNNVCYACHAEKRGPFLWDHPPVRENCLNCHSPHGSNNPKLLTARAHLVCQQCHIHMLPRHSTTAGQALDIWSMNRGCMNCHGQVHGSNHPSGRTLTR